ncbi:hypothetical protein PU629_22010 [Pullulanibacillus sp. KACC 23026]|uniref:hypothetical protein n=1 Tax=Pullulanibacillus sp. KACC 23026 TaxID=3028315 RepID=UPI0023AF7369|nr:hypothetical protein [Pullulanibacillus sp. KACC 23026]WEG12704.1 hypothetical protein PU629_22010 [Pullulanibacillus sp. KACC 23026]
MILIVDAVDRSVTVKVGNGWDEDIALRLKIADRRGVSLPGSTRVQLNVCEPLQVMIH